MGLAGIGGFGPRNALMRSLSGHLPIWGGGGGVPFIVNLQNNF